MNCAAHLLDSRFPSPGQRTAISDNWFQMQFKPAGLMEIYTLCRSTNCAAHLPDSRFPSPGQRTVISDNCYFKVVSNAVYIPLQLVY